MKYGEHLASPRTFDYLVEIKIIVREITGKYPRNIIATYSMKYYLFNRSNIVIVPKSSNEISLKYVLGILNSTLISYWFLKNIESQKKMFPKIILKDSGKFPVKKCKL